MRRLLLLAVLLMAACDDDGPTTTEDSVQPGDKTVCHWSGGEFVTLPVDAMGFEVHMTESPHGDVFPVPDDGCTSLPHPPPTS